MKTTDTTRRTPGRLPDLKWSCDAASGDLYEHGQPVGKLITGNSGAWLRLIQDANQSSAPALLAALKEIESGLLPYRGSDCSPQRAYLLGREIVQQVRAAIAQAERGEK